MFNKSMLPMAVAFLVTGGLILALRSQLAEHNVDWQVLTGANLFLYVITVLSVSLLSGGMKAATTHAFLRKAYGGIMLKLFGCAIAAFIYILASGDNLNKGALFVSMGLYLVYSFLEVRIILSHTRQKQNNG